MTLVTVSLSVLIFALFYLIYMNMLSIGRQLGNDLKLVVYLEDEPGPEMQEQMRKKIFFLHDCRNELAHHRSCQSDKMWKLLMMFSA